MSEQRVLVLDGTGLTIEDVVHIARAGEIPVQIRVGESALSGMSASVRLRDRIIAQQIPVYGVTTGFGDSANRQVAPDRAARLQHNLVRYHLNGVGPIASADVTRATILIRANCLVRGHSGIRVDPVLALLRLLEQDVLPEIPERGSLGASGDLVPLCYLAATLIGEGEVRHRGRIRQAGIVLDEIGVAPVVLEPKEGLALINGTSFTSAFAALALWDAREIAFASDVATALATEALGGNASHFHPFLHKVKPHLGQNGSASLIRALLDGSRLATNQEAILAQRERLNGRGFTELRRRIQDKYSIRCAPHVIGVLRDTLDWTGQWVEAEINSTTDNPLFDQETEDVYNGGNFYAGHVGHAMDSLKLALASVADLLDRQLALVVDEKFNGGLPANLVPPRAAEDADAGLHHGFKGMQIACSALTAEALKMTTPATAFSRSTEAHNQDKVSMGTIAARDARTVAELTRQVLAIHLLASTQAVDLRGSELSAPALQQVHTLIRARVPFVDTDRRMDHDIACVAELIATGAVRRAIGRTDPMFPERELPHTDPRSSHVIAP